MTNKKPKKTNTEKINGADVVANASEALSGTSEFIGRVKTNMSAFGESLSESREKTLSANRELALKLVGFAQSNLDRSCDTVRDLIGANSLKDAVAIQSRAFKTAVETSIDQARDISELAANHHQLALQPVSNFFSESRA